MPLWLIAALALFIIVGGIGFIAHVLWIAATVILVLLIVGWVMGKTDTSRWYRR